MGIVRRFLRPGQELPISDVNIDYLVVGGGGAGGTSFTNGVSNFTSPGGGGGAGGYVTGTMTLTKDSTYTIVVGAGGAPLTTWYPYPPASYFDAASNSSFDTISACGGGAGFGYDGASGGGAVNDISSPSNFELGGNCIVGQGNKGGDVNGLGRVAGGGGGAGSAGCWGVASTSQPAPPDYVACSYYNSGSGGNGCQWLDGNLYAGGGGGGGVGNDVGASFSSTRGLGVAGGGNGCIPINSTSSFIGENGAANTGGGGGGTGLVCAGGREGVSGRPYDASNGGSGIVAIAYCSPTQLISGGTVTCVNGCVFHHYTSSCSISLL